MENIVSEWKVADLNLVRGGQMYRKDFLVLHLKSTAAYSTIYMVYKDPKLAGAALG